MNEIEQAQQTVRNLSPDYLSNNPLVGIIEVMADITRRLTPHEFRKPFVRLPDENDERPECNMCLGDKTCYITEEQGDVDCPYCGAKGYLEFNYNQVFIIVYRDFHSIEALVTVAVNGDCHAVVTVAEAGFKPGQPIDLTEAECDLCQSAVKGQQ